MNRYTSQAIPHVPARPRSMERLSLRASVAVIFFASLGLWTLIALSLYTVFD